MSNTDDETMGDYWRDVAPAMKQESQERRARNRTSSAGMLTQAGIAFESKNDGAHLIVTCGVRTYDFWPGTGLWQMRGSTQRRRGVRSLMNQIRRNP